MPVKIHGSKASQKVMSGLKFGRGNAKLADHIHTFSLPSGHTCPGACQCLAKAKMVDGRPTLVDGPSQVFRCFSASEEVSFKSVRLSRQANLEKLKACKGVEAMTKLILDSLNVFAQVVRIHVGGDFYSQTYFDAWAQVAKQRPDTEFYAYTKSIPFWRNWLNRHGELPSNMMLTASLGGKFDDLILPSMITARVVTHPDEALALDLEIDHDDSHAQENEKDFALLIHGHGRPGSAHSLATRRLRPEAIPYSYSK